MATKERKQISANPRVCSSFYAIIPSPRPNTVNLLGNCLPTSGPNEQHCAHRSNHYLLSSAPLIQKTRYAAKHSTFTPLVSNSQLEASYAPSMHLDAINQLYPSSPYCQLHCRSCPDPERMAPKFTSRNLIM